MRTMLFEGMGKAPTVLRLVVIGIVAVVCFSLMFFLVSTGVDAVVNALVTALKTTGGLAVMLSPIGLIKLGVL